MLVFGQTPFSLSHHPAVRILFRVRQFIVIFMKKMLWILVLGYALCSNLFGLESMEEEAGICLANVGSVNLGWDDTFAFEGDWAFSGEDGD